MKNGSAEGGKRSPCASGWRIIRLLAAAVIPLVPACLSLRGGVVAWGDNSLGQTNAPASLTNVVAVAAGRNFCLALNRDGSVAAWGDNSLGQTNVPASLTNAVELGAGVTGSLAVRTSGTIAVWGFVSAPPADLTNGVTVGAGYSHYLALRTSGTLNVWGDNSFGQTNIPAGLSNIVAIAAGAYHSLALKADGSVAAWGDNTYGQCNVPAGLSNVIGIAGGYRHSLALKADGTVTAWGNDSYAQLDIPAGLSNVVAVAAGNLHNLALRRDGTVVAWGDNSYAQLSIPAGLSNVVAISAGVLANFSVALVGEGSPAIYVPQPPSLSTYSGIPVQFRARIAGAAPLTTQWQLGTNDIPGATNRSLFLASPQTSDAGAYRVVVSNSLGVATSTTIVLSVTDSPPILLAPLTNQVAYPGATVVFRVGVEGSGPLNLQWKLNGNTVPAPTGVTLSFVPTAATNIQCLVVVSNPFGSLTNSASLFVPPAVGWTETPPITQYPITFPPAGLTDLVAVAAVSTGFRIDYGIRRDGTVASWNSYSFASDVPAGLTKVEAIAIGKEHRLALRTDGTIVPWGGNTYGQTNVPYGLSDAVAIAAGPYWSMALRESGTVVAWGTPAPAVPYGLSSVVAISAGANHAAALKADGTVVAWGSNSSGQTNIPAGLSNVVAIAAQHDYTMALKADGTLVDWGFAVAIPGGLSNVVAVAAGNSQTYVLKNDGTVFSFGIPGYENPPPAGLTNVVGIFSPDGDPRASALVGNMAPFLTRQPLNLTGRPGSGFTFRVSANGSTPLTYQWQFNGTNIPGATDSALPLSNLYETNAGSYSVVVGNAFGATTSAVAVLTFAGATPPRLINPRLNGSVFSVSLQTFSNDTYYLQYKNALTDSNWITVASMAGDGTVRTLMDTNAVVPQRFYRVAIQSLIPACADAPAGLVSWWRAERSAADGGPAGNNGALAGNASYGAGEVGQAFVFDGVNDGVQLGSPASLELQDFTIEAWVKRANLILATGGGDGSGDFLGWDTGGYAFGVFDDGRLDFARIGVSRVTTAALLTDTSWHHVAVAKSGTNVVFYLDGVAYPAPAYDPGFTFAASAVIGARADLSHSFWGSIDELSFYNRALSASEIQGIYSAPSAGKCAP